MQGMGLDTVARGEAPRTVVTNKVLPDATGDFFDGIKAWFRTLVNTRAALLQVHDGKSTSLYQ
jgi:hypothetical protein